MSTMNDKESRLPRFDNIKGLVQDLTEKLDVRMHSLRVGTEFEHLRPSDAKTFMLIARHPRHISELARDLGITRQATHNSILRLIENGLIELHPAPGSKRDKIPLVTEKGQALRRFAAKNLFIIEAELEAKIGAERLEQLRGILIELLQN